MNLCIYLGGYMGFVVNVRFLEFLRKLPAREYTVIANEYYNRENHPPMPVFVFKH